MLAVNADDWGRSRAETDAALQCYGKKRITSVSAMVFMEDSERAAALAKERNIDVGLHLNFSEPFSANPGSAILVDSHRKISSFLTRNKYAQLLYNPLLREVFVCSCRAQIDEFARLYDRLPSRVDGHHHLHLCANVVLGHVIPPGMKVRRHFSFWPKEKSLLNRGYRNAVNWWLARKYRLADYFFDLTQCIEEKKFYRVKALARSSDVELMTHPIIQSELEYLMGDDFLALLEDLEVNSGPPEALLLAKSLHERVENF
jgi:chitin disaccharide deacetylase